MVTGATDGIGKACAMEVSYFSTFPSKNRVILASSSICTVNDRIAVRGGYSKFAFDEGYWSRGGFSAGALFKRIEIFNN